jgi:general secretion pathway protein C
MGTGATVAALALLGVVLAYWSWAWLAPSPVPRAPAALQTLGGTSSAGGLFRSVKEGPGGAAASASVRLMGIVAGSEGRPGNAVLRVDERRTLAVPQGGEVEPGVRLAEVHVDHIVIERNGARETLAWPEKKNK